MNDVLGHHVILVAAATAFCAMSYFTGWPRRAALPDQETAAIVVVPQHLSEPKSRVPAAQVRDVPVPRDVASFTREIQRELKRVGCYGGEMNGRWNTQSRLAMKAFMDQINAKLPVDRPDYVLLRLAQGHQGPACGATGPNTSFPLPPSLLREGRMPVGGAKAD